MAWFYDLFTKNKPLETQTTSLEQTLQNIVMENVEEDIPSYFDESEFACKCGCGKSDVNSVFLKMLNKARHIDGKPWRVNSGTRCAKHNASEGGKRNSAHLHGCAADIYAPTSARKFAIVSAAMQAGFNRIGVGSNFVHLDADTSTGHPANVLWTY